jgi:hypothetical protein
MSKKPKPSFKSEAARRFARDGWLTGCDLNTEAQQAREEGRDLRSVAGRLKRLQAVPDEKRGAQWLEETWKLLDRIQTLPFIRKFPYREPSDLAGIRAARPDRPGPPEWKGDRAEFLERLHGGWLGRIAGCMLGKPVEGWYRSEIRLNAEAIGNWPLENYWRAPTAEELSRIEAAKPRRKLDPKRRDLLRETMDGMVEDDDTNYTTIGFAVVKRHGKDFTPCDVAAFWCGNVPIFHTYSAERAAYRNFARLILPPESAAHRNPFREWIGAQIRADYFGYANPGRPERAAEWAWRDACISHVRNGIYGEMWVAAMLAAAYVERDWIRILRAGLAQVPARCRLAADVEQAISWRAEGLSYEAAVDRLHARWDEKNRHHWCHTNSNAQVVALALLYGEDDFGRTIARAVMPGFDTDCNGATAGSLWGVRHGVKRLPELWTAPLRDRIRTGVHGYHDAAISKMAEEMTDTALAAQ